MADRWCALKLPDAIRGEISPLAKGRRATLSPTITWLSFHQCVHQTWWSVLPSSARKHQLLLDASPSTLHHVIENRAVPWSRVSLWLRGIDLQEQGRRNEGGTMRSGNEGSGTQVCTIFTGLFNYGRLALHLHTRRCSLVKHRGHHLAGPTG